jgi:hypothetical protein
MVSLILVTNLISFPFLKEFIEKEIRLVTIIRETIERVNRERMGKKSD